MDIDVSIAGLVDKPILNNLLQLYLHDFSELDDSDLEPSGFFQYEYLDRYWTEEGRHPFLVRVGGVLAGFVLVNQYGYLGYPAETKAIAEFFIMRKYRRKGIGQQVAFDVFSSFPGKWEVPIIPKNEGARFFWRKVIERFTQGRFQEVYLDEEIWKGWVIYFDNSEG